MTIDKPVAARRGDASREALIQAAIDVFGRRGYDGASTRNIAEAAGVNQALIGYHFGGKSALYLAVFEHIAAAMQQRLGPVLGELERELGPFDAARHDADSAQRCLARLLRVIDGLIEMMTSQESAAWANLILREQQRPSEGFDVLYTRFMSRIFGVITGLIGRVRNIDPASVEARLTALTIVGQVLVFRAARAAVMRQTGWETIGADEVALMRRTIHSNVTAMLSQENAK